MKLLWSAGLRVVDAGKRHLKHAQWFRSLPALRYTYLFDLPKAIVVPELRLVFVPTPKAANRSIKAAIRCRLDPEFRGDPHHGWRYTPVALMRDNDFFRFGFVRNPLDRLLSSYTQKIVHYGRDRAMPLEFWRYGKAFHPDMSFADFVHAVAAIPDRLADIHFRSQHTFFYHRGRLMADFIGRYERLDEDWEHLRRQFGFDALPHLNRSSHRDYRDAYSPELARVAARRYRQDIALFGYEAEVAGVLGEQVGDDSC